METSALSFDGFNLPSNNLDMKIQFGGTACISSHFILKKRFKLQFRYLLYSKRTCISFPLWLALQVFKSFGILGLKWLILTNPVSDHLEIYSRHQTRDFNFRAGGAMGVVVVVVG